MVAIDHGHGPSDGDELCPRCQFVEGLTAYLDRAASGCLDDWGNNAALLLEHVRRTVQALVQLHPAVRSETGGDGGCVEHAAVTVVQLLDALNELREQVVAESSLRN